ncbi:hypothetical protein [Ruegeria arenilitoris]|uniref:Phytanoyl-CoA dioxygenase (PhyH) n=1 Tax=Ruegeria arenilitoris TaxID=1173585 RepID=A0A238JXK5_9RHOB|nr:hypothetical protein [Ruegeria arenilitoris]SMX35381.1 hypothetical protein RUA8715_00974 [Ruegeria arenilitoris]
MVRPFWSRGWEVFPYDKPVADWVTHALPLAQQAASDPAHRQWLDCEDTWFIGVDALPNDGAGRVGASAPLSGQVVEFLVEQYGAIELHKGQVSVVYPGYPRPRRGENEAAARYRAKRDAAHVDGLKPGGPDRRRKIDEPHAWVLGIPLTQASADAAPLVVWDGSHKIMGAAFRAALAGVPRTRWAQTDITEAYQAARRKVFEACPRIEVSASPGETYVLHRHSLHGVAPWGVGATAGPDGRMIAYFRPELPGGVAEWVESP